MRKSKVLVLAMTMIVSMTAFSGCNVFEKDTKDGRGPGDTKILRYSINNEPPTLDPQLNNSMYGATIAYHIFEGLMRNNDGTIEPACAERYELSEDGLVYTFHLRKGLVWSDGQPLTAKDFVYGIQRLVNPATASPISYMGTVVKNAAKVNGGELPVEELGVKALDDSTLEITLENPAGYFLGVVTNSGYYPCREDLVEKYGKDFAADADKNVYNGPFVLSTWNHGSKLLLEKNENSWKKDAVKLNIVEIPIVTEANTSLGLYEKKELDFAVIPSALIANYPDAKMSYAGSVEYLQINVSANKTLGNKNFRNALNAAINREELVTLATSNVNKLTTRYVPPQISGLEKTYGEEYPLDAFSTTNDNVKAKQFLTEAMEELEIASPSDIKIVLNIADADSCRKQAEVLQEQFKMNLGITLEINQLPYKQLYELHSTRDYEMILTGWVPDYSDPFSYLDFFETGNGYNNSVYSSPDYDKYIQKAKDSIDTKARLDNLFEAEKILCQDLPVIPLDLTYYYYLLNDDVTNFKPYFVGTDLNYIQADMKKHRR